MWFQVKLLILILCPLLAKCFGREIICDKSRVDDCAHNILNVFNANSTVSLNKESIDQYCNELPMNIKCVRHYIRRCVNTFTRLALYSFLTGFRDYFNGLCAARHTFYFYRSGYNYHNQSNKTHKMNGSTVKINLLIECHQSAREYLKNCSQAFIDSFTQISFLKENSLKFPLMCCHYWLNNECIVDALTKASRKTGICTNEHVTELISLNNAMNDYLIKSCRLYSYVSENCNKIVGSHKLNKTGTYKLPKTLLIPYLDILQSFQ